MSEMVERVAKAICDEEYKKSWETFVPTARAAIEAMREPTEAMENGAFGATMTIPTRAYQAMIDAALK